MKTILCPTDFSKISVNAVEYAAGLTQQFKLHIILLHVYEAPELYSELPLAMIKNAEENVKIVAQKKLLALKNKLLKNYKNLTVETILNSGDVKDQIVDLSGRKNADMIIMGATGTNKLQRLLLGSTTERVIQNADCPVMSVPGDLKFNSINKIVFATDLRDDNLSAALTITSFARHFNAEIIFVFVDDRNIIHSDEKIAEMTQKIRKKVKYPKLSGYISKNISISKGLEYFLSKTQVDMLVMFSHSKHFPQTLFNQSITKIMSHQVKIPLLALKIPDRPLISE